VIDYSSSILESALFDSFLLLVSNQNRTGFARPVFASDPTQHYIAQQLRYNCQCLQFHPRQLLQGWFALAITETQAMLKAERRRRSIK